MRNFFIVMCSVLAFLGFAFFVSSCKDRSSVHQSTSVEHASAEKSQFTPEAPGVTMEVEEETPVVEIPIDRQQLIGVRTVQTSVQQLRKTIRTTGKIEYDERRLTTINTKVEGWIEKLHVNFTGVYVKKGEPLAQLYSPELWSTQQEFINLVRWAKKTGSQSSDFQKTGTSHQPDPAGDMSAMLARDVDALLEAARQRLKLWDIADDQIRMIEESEKPMRSLTIYSPVSGYVLQKYAVRGMRVMAGEKLFDVSDLSNVWIVADIYEYEMPVVKVGDHATIRLSYFPGKELMSIIEFVSPTLSTETRTAQARFSIPNTGGRLKPGMFADVELTINLGRKLAVPDEAVIDTGLRQIVYVDKGDGYFEPRAVTTGLRAEKFVEVIAGLKAGEKVASSANFLIDSEAKLRGIEPNGSPPGAKQGALPPPVDHRH